MRLERSDRHAELVPLLRVLDAQLERGAGEADEGTGREHAPFVDRALVQRRALASPRASTCVRSPVRSERSATGAAAEVVDGEARSEAHPRPRPTRRRRGRRPLIATAPAGHEPGHPVVRRVQGDAWRARGCASASRVERAALRASLACRAAVRSPTPRRGGRARARPRSVSPTSSRSSSAAPPPPADGSTPIVGPAQCGDRAPELAGRSRPPPRRLARRVGGHSLAKNARNASTSWSCSSVSERSTVLSASSARRRRERRRHALPAADHRPVGIVDDRRRGRCGSRACVGARRRSSPRT